MLLSLYDEYTIAYKDRSDIAQGRYIETMISMGNALTAVIILNGTVAGTWKRLTCSKGIDLILNPFRELGEHEKASLRSAVEDYGRFFELPVTLHGL
ncbi:hypothetical protein DGWBC_1595 [Dehalogenimonas sp. WBC-2]|nr:hypothetical protein DGWBC_1595 [Dehalogenimonas sp. WBC-2]